MAANENRDMDAAFGLRLAFDSDDPAFARGFEAGALWEGLQESDGAVQATVHASNAEMVLRMAEALGRRVIGEQRDRVWMDVTFDEPCSDEAAGPSPRPGFL